MTTFVWFKVRNNRWMPAIYSGSVPCEMRQSHATHKYWMHAVSPADLAVVGGAVEDTLAGLSRMFPPPEPGRNGY